MPCHAMPCHAMPCNAMLKSEFTNHDCTLQGYWWWAHQKLHPIFGTFFGPSAEVPGWWPLALPPAPAAAQRPARRPSPPGSAAACAAPRRRRSQRRRGGGAPGGLGPWIHRESWKLILAYSKMIAGLFARINR